MFDKEGFLYHKNGMRRYYNFKRRSFMPVKYFFQSQSHIPEDMNLRKHCCENFKPCALNLAVSLWQYQFRCTKTSKNAVVVQIVQFSFVRTFL